jgi:cytochrome c nitrite reductase small subunit
MSPLIRVVSHSVYEQADSFLRDPAEYYGARLLITTLVVATAVTVYSLLRYRGRTNGPAAWTGLVLSVCVLPSFAVLLGTFLVFERAERVEFCGSCHAAMSAYVADMRNTDSPSLAAVHYRNRYIPRNQCYICHTSFGLFGTMRAKIAGVEDVRRYYLSSFHQPITMRGPYENGECLKCHGDAVRWVAKHSNVRDAILAGQASCLGCHGGVHPAHLLH